MVKSQMSSLYHPCRITAMMKSELGLVIDAELGQSKAHSGVEWKTVLDDWDDLVENGIDILWSCWLCRGLLHCDA